ncbi:MAG: HIT domain-containing protein [Proteobacteria bacterium]|jgi:ATP adenylyltransferase|nr:HIT domain-containing protein [Pseudomonadota bacterium]
MAKKKMAKKNRSVNAGKSRKLVSLQADQNIWPLERDVLFRPDRFKYVRKVIQPQGCVFCAASGAEPSVESLCFYQTKNSMMMLNKFPYNSGHILILPRRHVGDLTLLSDEEYFDLQSLVRTGFHLLEHVYQPGGLNFGLNHGAVAGAGIPDHLHYHLIPRWSGDLNFFPLIAETKAVIESLDQSFEKLKIGMKKLRQS